jgi:hypothetical protein
LRYGKKKLQKAAAYFFNSLLFLCQGYGSGSDPFAGSIFLRFPNPKYLNSHEINNPRDFFQCAMICDVKETLVFISSLCSTFGFPSTRNRQKFWGRL